MLVIGMIQIILPVDNIKTSASAPPPSDSVNGAYTQYIEGNWTVTGTEVYSDEIIVLSGNLTIQSGGSLTLKNVTLAMNCSNENGTHTIEVFSGGSLNITDGDNNPATTHDRSNITDSPFDSDDMSPLDYRTSIRVYDGATITMSNSIIRECGFPEKVWDNNVGVYTNTDYVNIQNCTFENNYYGLYLWRGDYHRIAFNEFRNCNHHGVLGQWSNYVKFYNNEIHHCDYGVFLALYYSSIFNNEIHNNSNTFTSPPTSKKHGLCFWYGDYTKIYNNTIKHNGGSGSSNLEIINCDEIEIFDNFISDPKPGGTWPVNIYSLDGATFYNNTIVNSDSYGIFFGMSGTNNKFKIYNNNISNHSRTGLYIGGWSSPTNRLEVKNNTLTDNEIGLRLNEIRNYEIQNNTIRNCSDYGVYVNDVSDGDFSNNTVNATYKDFGLRDSYGEMDTVLEVVNCTFNTTKVLIQDGRPMLKVMNFLHVNVYDNNSIVPGATVTIKNNTGITEFTGQTNMNGTIRYIKVLNQTINHKGTLYYGPHNLTVSYNVFNEYAEPELIMNRTQTVNIHFNFDLPPHPVTMLNAISNNTNVDLSWKPSLSNDVDHYLVYRNGTGSSWIEVYNSSSNPPEKSWTNWTDQDGAANPATYSYKVISVDTLWQESPDSEIARCGDWVIDDTKMVNGLSGQMNGSLTILPSGNLTLRNSKIQFNNSYKGQYGVEVNPGGELYILDNDDDPQTTGDQTVISTLDMVNTSFFNVVNAKLFIRNSKISNFGFDGRIVEDDWTVESAPDVLTIDKIKNRGLYLGNSVATIENSVLSNNFAAILLDNSDAKNIKGNVFSNNTFGIFYNNVNNNSISENTFDNNDGLSIYILNSENITIEYNTINSPVSIRSVIGLYGQGCKDNTIFSNNLTVGENGIKLIDAGRNNNITNNNFKNQNNSIFIQSTYWNTIMNNNFENIDDSSVYLESAHYTSITGGYTEGSKYGYFLENSNDLVISDIDMNDLTHSGLYLNNIKEIEINRLSINSSSYGLYVYGGKLLNSIDLSITNCTTGIYCSESTGKFDIFDSKIENGINTAIKLTNWYIFALDNCTLGATIFNFDLSNSNALLFNITYDQNKVRLDLSSSMYINWYIDVQVIDQYGTPEVNANIQIRESRGTLLYNVYSDSSGRVKGLWLLERIQYSQSNTYSTPHSIKANSGNHSGLEVLNLNQSTEIQVHLENIEPEAKNIVITPLYPTTMSNLILNYQYSDTENDPEDKTKIKWYIDGVYDSKHDNLTTITSASTSKGETWQCEIIPHDGAVYGTPMLSTSVTIQNTEPSISNVAILESTPRSDQDLHISYSYSDIDSDPEVGSQHKWYYLENSNWVYSNVDSEILPTTFTKKGESWKCIVKPYDGDDFGTEVQSPPVNIGNTPPTITSARITPLNPKGEESIRVEYDYYDLDSDPESGSLIKWFKNDVEYVVLSNSSTIEPTHTTKGDKWHYTIIPSDGTDQGEPFESEAVIIGNTAPTVVNITISPENPTTADDLIILYEFVDDDGDTESFDTNFQWLRKREGDISFTYRNLRVKTLSSTYTEKNEIWTCEVTPHDGYVYGETVRAQVSVMILNSEPSASELFITPEKPKTKSDLTANYKFADLDSDIESGTELRWYQDDQEVTELRDSATVPSTQTAKGQEWYFTVTPKDGQDFGITMNSSSVYIQNSPPKVKNAQILPKSPTGDDDLYAAYEYSDEDGDIEAAPEIRWFEDGIPMPEFDNQLTVGADAVDKDENWHFVIQVFDGIDYSDEVSSNHPEIGNSFAFLKSISPAVGTVKTVILNETDTQFFQINAVDPDDDLILFRWRLDDQLVSQDDSYLFTTNYDGERSAGTYTLILEFLDFTTATENKTVIEWEIIVQNVNRKPIITDKEPIAINSVVKVDKSLKFSVTSTDPDKDKLITKWYFDNVDTGQTGSSFAYLGKLEDLGAHEVKAVVSDGTDTAEYSWNITVEEKVEEAREEIAGLSVDMWGLILAVISGIVAITMFLFGIIRMNRKKGKLKEYMDKIEEIAKADKDPRDKENELKLLKKKIRDEFSMGLIVENHYLILEREADNAIGETRTEIVEERVAMPEQLKEDVSEVLEDGVITKDEYQIIMNNIRFSNELNPLEKSKLSSLMTRWMVEGSKDEVLKGRPKSDQRSKPKPRRPETYETSKRSDRGVQESRRKKADVKNQDDIEIEFDEL
jgi:parallel beta-helix repeat protein